MEENNFIVLVIVLYVIQNINIIILYNTIQYNTTSTSPNYFLKVEYRPGLSNIIKYLDSFDTSFFIKKINIIIE
jgi:hypothetical protein